MLKMSVWVMGNNGECLSIHTESFSDESELNDYLMGITLSVRCSMMLGDNFLTIYLS